MTTQIDNWEERIKDNRVMQILEEILGLQKHGANKERYVELWDSLMNDDEYALKEFIQEQITLAKEEGVKEERERWINQTVNQHDEKIRAEERKRIVEIIKEYCLEQGLETYFLPELLNKID